MHMDTIDAMNIVSLAITESDNSFFTKRKKNQRIDFGHNGNIYALSKGTISFYSVDDSMLCYSICAPAVIGLFQFGMATPGKSEKYHYYIRCNDDCDIWIINQSDIIEVFNRKELWVHAFYIQSYYLSLCLEREAMTHKRSARDVVIEHIKFIWGMEADLRDKISIYTFILSRNHISRSSVHKVVAELVSSGVIKLKRGKIVSFEI